MDQILSFVQELLAFLNEGEASEIVGMVKDSGIVEMIVNFIKSLIG